MSKKLNKRGFTLAELLVVVAIIAILVVVSIPIFTAQLEKSKEATDVANMRAAKAAMVTAYLSEDADDGITVSDDTWVGYYDADSGELVKDKGTLAYGQGTSKDGGTAGFAGYTGTTKADGLAIQVTLTLATEKVTMAWN